MLNVARAKRAFEHDLNVLGVTHTHTHDARPAKDFGAQPKHAVHWDITLMTM